MSIAVLPFTTSGTDGAADLGSSIAEQVWSGLASVPELRVIARESSFSLASTGEDVPDVAAKLGVGTIVSGSVRRTEQGIEVSAQLLDGETGNAFWSRTYEYEFSTALSPALIASTKFWKWSPLPVNVFTGFPSRSNATTFE